MFLRRCDADMSSYVTITQNKNNTFCAFNICGGIAERHIA